jgi:hypothetical protein
MASLARGDNDIPNYDELLKSRDASQAVMYKISSQFNEKDVIDHKVFGIGLVTRITDDDKIEVVPHRDQVLGSRSLANFCCLAQSIGRMLTARRPLGPSFTSNSTLCPSVKVTGVVATTAV